jgi:hypothetical protein
MSHPCSSQLVTRSIAQPYAFFNPKCTLPKFRLPMRSGWGARRGGGGARRPSARLSGSLRRGEA